MARHRSPSGARPDVPHAPQPEPRQPGPPQHAPRLPAPPAACLRGRITLVAAAAGAVVAGGQTAVNVFDEPPVVAAALVPVAETREAPPPPGAAPSGPGAARPDDAIGADRSTLRVGPLGGGPAAGSPGTRVTGIPATDGLDARSAVDVHNLAKATDIGEQLAKRARVLRAALADGAPEAAMVADQAFVRPTLGRLTSAFGARWGVQHQGIDIANAIGTPIYALTDGVVEESGPASGFGMWVVVRHPSGERTVYGHINRSHVAVGQPVRAGERIADMGNRGFSTGPHLHLEVWSPDGTKLNPVAWLSRRGLAY